MKDKDLNRRFDELRNQLQDYSVDHTTRHGTIWEVIRKLENQIAQSREQFAGQVRTVINTVEVHNLARKKGTAALAERVKKLEECKPNAELTDRVTDAWSAIENLRWRENETHDAVKGQVGEALAGISQLKKQVKQLGDEQVQDHEQKNNKLARLTKATSLEADLRRENDDVLAQRIGKLEEQTEATNETIVHIQNDRSVVWEAVERIRKYAQPDPERVSLQDQIDIARKDIAHQGAIIMEQVEKTLEEHVKQLRQRYEKIRVPLQDQIDVVDKRIAKLGDHNVGAINSLAKRVKNLEEWDNTLPERIEKLEKFNHPVDDLWKAIREARELGMGWHDTTMSQVRASQARVRKLENECIELRAELGISREDDPHTIAMPRSGQPIRNKAQLDKLATYILDEIPGEPSCSGEGFGDNAIRLLKKYRRTLGIIEEEAASLKKVDMAYIVWLAQNTLRARDV